MRRAQQISRFLWAAAAIVWRKSLAVYTAQTSLQLTILSTRINAHSTMPSFRSWCLEESWGKTGYSAITSTQEALTADWMQKQTEDSIDLFARQEGCMENYKAYLPHGNEELCVCFLPVTKHKFPPKPKDRAQQERCLSLIPGSSVLGGEWAPASCLHITCVAHTRDK